MEFTIVQRDTKCIYNVRRSIILVTIWFFCFPEKLGNLRRLVMQILWLLDDDIIIIIRSIKKSAAAVFAFLTGTAVRRRAGLRKTRTGQPQARVNDYPSPPRWRAGVPLDGVVRGLTAGLCANYASQRNSTRTLSQNMLTCACVYHIIL